MWYLKFVAVENERTQVLFDLPVSSHRVAWKCVFCIFCCSCSMQHSFDGKSDRPTVDRELLFVLLRAIVNKCLDPIL